MNHEIPFFWRFHSVHHSDNKMDVTTASRFHLGEIFFSSLFRIPLIVLVWMFMFPLVGAGVAGLNVGIDMAIGSLVRHWIYVIPFIFLINKDIFPKEAK